jgi:hypothetical protein
MNDVEIPGGSFVSGDCVIVTYDDDSGYVLTVTNVDDGCVSYTKYRYDRCGVEKYVTQKRQSTEQTAYWFNRDMRVARRKSVDVLWAPRL